MRNFGPNASPPLSPGAFAIGLALAAALILGAGDAPSFAQSGEGDAAFAVRVTDDEGTPISGAQVLAQASEAGAPGGPPPVTTDELGQAVVGGLAEGEWFVEVSHPSYMLFAAYVDLRAGKKPQVGFSSQVNTETSWEPMTVKFFKASAEARRGATTRRPAKPTPPEVVREAPRPTVEQPEPPRVVRPERPETEAAEASEPRRGQEPVREAAETVAAEPVEEPEPVADPVEDRSPELPAPMATAPDDTAGEDEVAAEAPVAEPVPSSTPAEAATTDDPSGAEPKPTDQPTPPSGAEEPAPVEPVEPLDPEPAERPQAPPAAPTAGEPLPDEPVPSADEEGEPPEVEELPTDEPSRLPPALEREPAAAADVIEPDDDKASPPAAAERPREEAEAPAARPTEADTGEASTTSAPTEPSTVVPPTSPATAEPETDTRAAPPPPARRAAASAEPDDEGTPGAAARLPRFLRSAAGGNCPECEAGEWAVAAEQEAARAGESRSEQQCSEAFVDGAAAAAELLADRPAPRLESYVGPVLTAMWRLPAEDRATAEELLGPRTDPSSHCQLAGVVLPTGSEFSGYVIEAWDVLGGRGCLAGFDCAVGQSRWLGEPEIVVGEERTVVYGIFKNRSTRRERRARLTVYFRPPSDDWTPATR